jgi:hypothetical protein
MKLYLHCGFPKTGTTALQKWLSVNQEQLHALDIDYPDVLRDEEGFGHHRLNSLVEAGPSAMARKVSSLCSSSSRSAMLLSSEGLSNLLGAEQASLQIFLPSLLEELLKYSIEPALLITLRPLQSYLRSIIVQNVLYDGLTCKPSDYGAYTIDALTRAYHNLSDLLASGKVRLFQHSMKVNQQILDHIAEETVGHLMAPKVTGVEHASPPDITIIMFLWLNIRQISITPDFHSYLRFGESSSSILKRCATTLFGDLINRDESLNKWEPSADLVHAIMGYYNMAWQRYFGFKASHEAGAKSSSSLILRRTILADLKAAMYDALGTLDFYYEIALSPKSQPVLFDVFRELVDTGSIEYGKSLLDV